MSPVKPIIEFVDVECKSIVEGYYSMLLSNNGSCGQGRITVHKKNMEDKSIQQTLTLTYDGWKDLIKLIQEKL